jgi:hypothetical protein
MTTKDCRLCDRLTGVAFSQFDMLGSWLDAKRGKE